MRLPLCPLTVTTTAARPAVPAGVTAVIVVPLCTATLVASVWRNGAKLLVKGHGCPGFLWRVEA